MSAAERRGHPFRRSGRLLAAAVIVFIHSVVAATPGAVRGAELQGRPAHSLSEWRWLGVTRQEQPYACGVAAWKTWVSALGIPLKEAERALSLQPDLASKPASLLDLYNLAKSAGLAVVSLRFSQSGLSEYLAAERPPLLLHLATGAGHFVVVSAPVDQGRVYIADPAAGWRSLPLDELLSMTSGSALVAATDWPANAGQDWARGLTHARERGRAFQVLAPAGALASEVGIEVTARLAQELVPRPGPAGTPVPAIRPQWLPLQASLVTSTRWGGRAGLSADIMLSVPVTAESSANTGQKHAGVGLSWGGRDAAAGRRSGVSLSCRWSEGPPSRYMWELALQEEVDTDPVRQCLGLAFSEIRSTRPEPGEGLQTLRLWGGVEVLLTPAFLVGGEVGLVAEDAGRVSVTSGVQCVWLRPEGHAWRLQLVWLAGQGVNIGLAYRHQWWSKRE